MRCEKSNLIYYVVAVVIVAALGLVMFHEIPLHQEHVEEVVKQL